MSPRRRIDADAVDLFAPRPPRARRSLAWLPAAAVALVVAAAISVSAVVFVNGQAQQRQSIRTAAVLSFVRAFVTQYTSLDPFNANAYADRVLALGTGDFAKFYSEKMNEIVVAVARAEPSVGNVQELGIERWNDDGSADVVAVAAMTTTMPDGKKIQSASRWVVTATEEGDQWRVSNLIQVI